MRTIQLPMNIQALMGVCNCDSCELIRAQKIRKISRLLRANDDNRGKA